MRQLLCVLVAVALIAPFAREARAQEMRVTGQILAYQRGYVFFTTGDAFHVAPNVVFDDAKTGAPTTLRPEPRLWARAVFDASGTIVELDLSKTQLAQEGDFSLVRRFVAALSSPVPNPDLVQSPSPTFAVHAVLGTGRLVVVAFKVEVPSTTPLDAIVYISTDASGWNPQAIPMQRVDALHFSVTERLAVGTVLHYLYTRGSFSSLEQSAGGIDITPHTATVMNVDDQVYNVVVYRWSDQGMPGQLLQPNVFPTPYNPGPFPNLPPGIHTPAPR